MQNAHRLRYATSDSARPWASWNDRVPPSIYGNKIYRAQTSWSPCNHRQHRVTLLCTTCQSPLSYINIRHKMKRNASVWRIRSTVGARVKKSVSSKPEIAKGAGVEKKTYFLNVASTACEAAFPSPLSFIPPSERRA